MANTIITKNSITASAVPTSGQLVQGELAVNVTDKRLFTENSAGTVVEVGTNPSTIAVVGNATVGGTLGVTGLATLASSTLTANPTLSGGTANGVTYLNGSKVLTSGSALTFDGTNLGIGTSSPGAKLDLSNGALRLSSFYQVQWFSGATQLGSILADSGSNITFQTGSSNTERARITSSGSLLVGAASLPSASVKGSAFLGDANQGRLYVSADNTGARDLAYWINPNGVVGTITTTGSATAYNTSSDYRLKNTITPMTGALAKVAALKPVTYKWNADGSNGEGFIAHELAEIVSGCVTGEKDAVDADGNPRYQGIDTSFLVATLTAAIQEQQALITSLTARITALEGN